MTETFEKTGKSRRAGVVVDFDILSTRMLSFDGFVVTEDLEMRLAGKSRRAGVAVDFDILSTRMWSFDGFFVTKDSEMRLAR